MAKGIGNHRWTQINTDLCFNIGVDLCESVVAFYK